MKSRVKINNQQAMVIALIICGGPIRKGNSKTIVQPEVSESVDKKQIKVDTEKGKKTSFNKK
ncbi:hypothetical protein [Sphingobacterium multivorum]|uniref:Uncharacterized protein n=1 Tax=Sphingobacterium multivorum TaxID=28454 RepID=A0A2X2IQT6_SPHMU|nr:hypothetical protein [Sphingobacterium multivorum]QRQ63382.1 hypothetical protein I6J33_10615 [Sphingobacterium multivorum]SPZ84642.1 Uncharacterised protein [Sphingobacterium multivorum]